MEWTGLYLTPGNDQGLPLTLARQAEESGYESLWVTHGVGRDSFLVLAAYAHATRRIGLANGVVPIYPRHPVAMAQEALTLAELSDGRFRLGIGVSHQTSMEQALGLKMGSPLEFTREYVSILRGALAGRVEHEGRYYRVRWATPLALPPTPVPVLLAGLSERMVELAAEIADGVVLWLCAPPYIRDVVMPAVRRGRQKAGRPVEGFEVVAAVPAAVTDDVVAVDRVFREELVRYLGLPFYRKMLRASGFAEELAAFDRDRASRPSAGEAIPRRLAAALGGIGDRSKVREAVREYREAGCTLPAVRPIGTPDLSHYRPTVEAARPS